MVISDDDVRDRTRVLPTPDDVSVDDSSRRGGAILILISHPEHEGLGARTRLETGTGLRIGRDPECELAFPEVPSLSRVHARIRFAAGGFAVEDLGSTNGTFVNDRRVYTAFDLASGDRIQFGSLHFKFLRAADVEAAYHEAIHQLVMQDGLTEIGNRRRFDDELTREFARADRHHRPLALVVFDIDRFKDVNDSLGHLGGDVVLKRIAEVCRRRLRPEQVFARVGGDEFAIISPETGLQGVLILAEKLRAAVAELSFDDEMVPADLRVTCSFGCAGMIAGMRSETDLIEAADRALYEAKQNGRNRVCPSAKDA